MPFGRYRELVPDGFGGKVVIDTNNFGSPVYAADLPRGELAHASQPESADRRRDQRGGTIKVIENASGYRVTVISVQALATVPSSSVAKALT